MAVNDPNTQVAQPDFWSSIAALLGNASGGRAAGRLQQALLNISRDQLANQQYGQSSQNVTAGNALALNRFGQESDNAAKQATFGLTAPSVRAGQAVQGDVLANAQDAEFSGLPSYVTKPTITGGLRPSMLSPTTRGAGRALTSLAADRLGQDRIDYPTAPSATAYGQAPPLTPVPEAGTLDSLLNVGSTGAGLLSALSNLLGGGNKSGGMLPLASLGTALKKLFGRGGGTDYGSQTNLPSDPGFDYGSQTNLPEFPPSGDVTTNWWVNQPDEEPDWDTYGVAWGYDEDGNVEQYF